MHAASIVTGDPERQAQAKARYPEAEIVSRAEDLWGAAGAHDLVVITTPNRFRPTRRGGARCRPARGDRQADRPDVRGGRRRRHRRAPARAAAQRLPEPPMGRRLPHRPAAGGRRSGRPVVRFESASSGGAWSEARRVAQSSAHRRRRAGCSTTSAATSSTRRWCCSGAPPRSTRATFGAWRSTTTRSSPWPTRPASAAAPVDERAGPAAGASDAAPRPGAPTRSSASTGRNRHSMPAPCRATAGVASPLTSGARWPPRTRSGRSRPSRATTPPTTSASPVPSRRNAAAGRPSRLGGRPPGRRSPLAHRAGRADGVGRWLISAGACCRRRGSAPGR